MNSREEKRRAAVFFLPFFRSPNQIRKPNLEIRNKFEKRNHKPKPEHGHDNRFEFRTSMCFGFRDSNFGFSPVSSQSLPRVQSAAANNILVRLVVNHYCVTSDNDRMEKIREILFS